MPHPAVAPPFGPLVHAAHGREATRAIHPLLLGRWSRRAFADRPVAREDVARLLEAARWAPSCFNDQPWLFVWAREPEDLARLRPLLNDKNLRWAADAPVLAFLFARRRFSGSGKPNLWAEHDAGAAWMSLAVQAHALGLSAHAMAGVHRDRVHEALGVPEADYAFLSAIAVGWPGDPASLPDDLRDRERANGRKPLDEVAHEGRFSAPLTPEHDDA